MTAEEEFQMEQYKTLRKEIESNTDEIRTLQRYSVVAIGAVWSWIATHREVQTWVAFLPVGFLTLAVAHSVLNLHDTQMLGFFIWKHIEPFFLKRAPGVGWESWLETKPSVISTNRNLLEDWRVWVNWAVMLGLSLIVAVLYERGSVKV